jgi:type II secretory pathway pseudopilin PulG
MLVNILLIAILIVLIVIAVLALIILGRFFPFYKAINNVRKDLVGIQAEIIKQSGHIEVSKWNLQSLEKHVKAICKDYHINA